MNEQAEFWFPVYRDEEGNRYIYHFLQSDTEEEAKDKQALLGDTPTDTLGVVPDGVLSFPAGGTGHIVCHHVPTGRMQDMEFCIAGPFLDEHCRCELH